MVRPVSGRPWLSGDIQVPQRSLNQPAQHSPAVAPAEADVTPAGNSSNPNQGRHPIDRLWYLMTSNAMLAAVVGALIVIGLLGLLLPQLPADLSQPEAVARWLATSGRRFGGPGVLMAQAGFFDIWHSLWLNLALGLLAFVLLLRLAQTLSEDWNRLRVHQTPGQLASTSERWPLRTRFAMPGSLSAAAAELADDLRSEGWQVGVQANETEAHLGAERSTWGLLAAPMAYAGLLLILAALWLNRVHGWRESGLILLPNTPSALSQPKYASLTMTTEDDVATVQALRADGTLLVQELSATTTARFPGITVRQTGEGLALAVSGQDQQGQPLQMRSLEEGGSGQTTLNLVFDQPRAERTFLVLDRELAFSVVAFSALPERGLSGPTFLVQAFRTGQSEPIVNDFLQSSASLQLDGDTYELTVQNYAVAEVSHQPGAFLMLVGGLLTGAGLALSLWRPTGRLYVRLTPNRAKVESEARLQPSPSWRQGERWLSAWATTYEGLGEP